MVAALRLPAAGAADPRARELIRLSFAITWVGPGAE